MLNLTYKPLLSFIIPNNLAKILALFVALTQGAVLLAAVDAIDAASGNAVPSVPKIAAQGYKLAFSDEFNGTKLDEDEWLYRTDSKERSTQLPANVTVLDGALHVAVKNGHPPCRRQDCGVMRNTKVKYLEYRDSISQALLEFCCYT